MSSEVLQAACRLAFDVARDDLDSSSGNEPPLALRGFLHEDEPPRRALTTAQQVIEEDSEFRYRVAQRATEAGVGRAGYLWLHRPLGWAQEFESLVDRHAEVPVSTVESNAIDGLAGPADNADLAEYGDGPDRGVESVYRNLTASEPIELVNPQPLLDPLPEPSVGDQIDPGVSPIEPLTPLGQPDQAAAVDEAQMTTDAEITADREIEPAADGWDESDEETVHLDDELPVEELTSPELSDGFDRELQPLAADPDHNGDTGDNGHDAGYDADFVDDEDDALENELASLRGLVERLASQRTTVQAEVVQVEPEPPEPDPVEVEVEQHQQHHAQAFEVDALQSDLDAVNHELTLATADLTSARHERDEARRKQSEALKRQVELEKELTTVRDMRAELEQQLTSSQATALSVEQRFGRLEDGLAEAEREAESLRNQLDAMTADRNEIRDERASLRAERDRLSSRLEEVDEAVAGADVVEMVASYRSATARLDEAEREQVKATAQIQHQDERIATLSAEAKALRTERMDLRARLGEAETNLEMVSTQYEALKVDAERMAAELGAARGEREGIESQLAELQTSLSDVLSEQAETRQRNDADRRALNELRVERDVLSSQVKDVEQAETEARSRIHALLSERDELLASRDELVSERSQLRNEMATLVTVRDERQAQLDEVSSELGPLRNELNIERRQREELANRLIELDDEAERNEAARLELAEERDRLQGLLEQMEAKEAEAKTLRHERDQLTADLAVERDQKLTELAEMQRQLEISASEIEALRETQRELEATRTELHELQIDREGIVSSLQRVRTEADGARGMLTAREAEVSEVRSELDALRQDQDALRQELASAREALSIARDDSDRLTASHQAELEAVEVELAATRVELYSANAELEAMALAPPVVVEPEPLIGEPEALIGEPETLIGKPEPVEDESAIADLVDEDDAVVAEVADEDSADDDQTGPVELPSSPPIAVDLEERPGPTETSTSAGFGLTPLPPLQPDPPAVPPLVSADDTSVPEAPVERQLVAIDPVGADTIDDLADDADVTDDLDTAGVADVELAGLEAPVEDALSDVSLDDAAEPVTEDGESDDLDEVSELVARKLSTFDPSEIGDVGSVPIDDELDLRSELRQDGGIADVTDTLVEADPVPPSLLGPPPGPVSSVEPPDLGVLRADGSKRRRIEIPADIAEDELAVARFVVSSPDVVLLIDGDSVAEMGWPSLPILQKRDALVTYLADLAASSGAAPDVVFDGRLGGDGSLPASRAVRIRLSTPPTPPSAALDELVDAYPDQWPIALVTDDDELASAAAERGAAVLNNGQLLDLFIAE